MPGRATPQGLVIRANRHRMESREAMASKGGIATAREKEIRLAEEEEAKNEGGRLAGESQTTRGGRGRGEYLLFYR